MFQDWSRVSRAACLKQMFACCGYVFKMFGVVGIVCSRQVWDRWDSVFKTDVGWVGLRVQDKCGIGGIACSRQMWDR